MENRELKVLFVDDDTKLGNSITEGLICLGYSVHYQSSLIAIEQVIEEFQPNIIILDIEIGDKDGIDDSARLRKLFPSVPIIFISSHVDPSYIERALNNGGATYLKKPFDIEELAVYINRYSIDKVDKIISVGLFILNCNSYQLTNTKTNNCQKLNKKESELVCLLVRNIGDITNRSEIIEKIWNGDFANDQNINNYIARIRKYLSSDASIQIETIPTEGYLLKVKNI